MSMDAIDLFGGVSSDEEDDDKMSTPTQQGSTSTLMAEMEMSDGDDPLETLVSEIRRKSNSTSPELSRPPEHAVKEKVTFFLSTDDENSLEMCDIERIAEENQARMEMEKKRKLEEDLEVTAHVTAIEPLAKRPKVIEEIKSLPQKEQSLLELIREKENRVLSRQEHVATEDVNGWSEEDQLHQLKLQILLKNMSKEQLDRFEVFRSSRFQRTTIRRLMKEFTGGIQIADNVVLAVAALAKIVIGDVVEEALDLRDAKEEDTNFPLQPHHVRQAFLNLKGDGKI